MTPMMFREQEVRQAYTMMSNSMMVVLTSLRMKKESLALKDDLRSLIYSYCCVLELLTWTQSG